MADIYLDHAATTPIHPDVVEAMLPYLHEKHGNPSSLHRFGRTTRSALDQARETVAASLGASPREITFTSGGTEADNFAVIGVAMANRDRGKHIITSQIEHHAVLDAMHFLEENGFDVTYLPVDKTGTVDLNALREAVRDDTILISIMYGNNEVGTIQPIEEIGEIAREHEIYFHSDCVQAYGMLPLDVQKLPVDLISVSSHKINGPKGVGALYAARNVKLAPILFGGNQERQRRAGTENVSGIVGFASAVAITLEEMAERRQKYEQFRRTMLDVWEKEAIDFVVNGHPERYLPHILNVSFPGTDTETMLMKMDLAGIAVSSGSACTSGSLQRSHVLKAMQVEPERLMSAIRFSFGLGNTEDEVQEAARKTADIVKRSLG
ncbi:MAG: cysteine desulfurase [Bacillaceae bacterium]|nr:cysteine desulfurase [Bacillaceae bacterium]